MEYYTINTEEMGEEVRKDSLVEIYKTLKEMKQDDKENKIKFNYYIVHHEIKKENNKIIDYVTEGKIYKRGNKIFFKPNR